MIDIFVCVKPRYPRGGDDHRSEIDRGCVSGFGNKEVIVESIVDQVRTLPSSIQPFIH